MIKEVTNLEDIKAGDKFIVKNHDSLYGYNSKAVCVPCYQNVEIVRITPKKTKWIMKIDGSEREIIGSKSYTGVLRIGIDLLTFEEEDIQEIKNINAKSIGIKRILKTSKGFDIKVDINKVMELSDDKIKSLSLDVADLFNNLKPLEKEI